MCTNTNVPGPVLNLNTWWTVHSSSTLQRDWWGGKEWVTVKCPLLQSRQYAPLCNSNYGKCWVSFELLRSKHQLFLRVWLKIPFSSHLKRHAFHSSNYDWRSACQMFPPCLSGQFMLLYWSKNEPNRKPTKTQTQRCSQIRSTVGAVTIYWIPAAFQVCVVGLKRRVCVSHKPLRAVSHLCILLPVHIETLEGWKLHRNGWKLLPPPGREISDENGTKRSEKEVRTCIILTGYECTVLFVEATLKLPASHETSLF